MFRFPLQLLSETCLILRRTEQGMIKMYVGVHVKYPLFRSDFKETSFFSTDFRKILQILENSCSGSRVVPCGWRTESGQTERHMTKLPVALRNLANWPKNENFVYNWKTFYESSFIVPMMVQQDAWMFIIIPTYAQTIFSIKLILKLLRHVSVLIHHLQGV